jgi:rhodanese-related sulfurtransferase
MKQGYKNVLVVKGGFGAMREAGFKRKGKNISK